MQTDGPALEPAPQPVCVLVGPPGSGKSTVGRSLAHALGVRFRDTDHDIEGARGQSVADIFTESGEGVFRALEREAVSAALTQHDGVLALGGGAIMDQSTRTRLRAHTVVFLDVGLAAAMRRLGMNRARPLLVGNVRGQWQKLMAERRPLYEEVADYTVMTDNLTLTDVVATVVDRLGGPR